MTSTADSLAKAIGMTPTTSIGAAVRVMRERAEIADLVSRLGEYLDGGQIDRLGEIFTPDVQFGAEPIVGLAAVQGHARQQLERWYTWQHVIADVLVELDGESATVRANLIATHVHREFEPESHWKSGVHYDFEATRTPSGWRFSRVVLDRCGSAASPQARPRSVHADPTGREQQLRNRPPTVYR